MKEAKDYQPQEDKTKAQRDMDIIRAGHPLMKMKDTMMDEPNAEKMMYKLRKVYPNKYEGKFKDVEVYSNPDVPEGTVYLMNPNNLDPYYLWDYNGRGITDNFNDFYEEWNKKTEGNGVCNEAIIEFMKQEIAEAEERGYKRGHEKGKNENT